MAEILAPGVFALPARVRLIFRGGTTAIAATDAALGLALPRAVCRSASVAGTDALWLGPDEWLLLTDQTIPPRLIAALRIFPHALVDISHRQAAWRVAGPHAAALLNAGCPLDLHPRAFPEGACTRTLLGKAEIVLWRTTPESFHIEIGRSFIPYVMAFLHAAARDLA
ncbi:MAG: sarcosine oxidase subunit gamma [Acetobacteraceae bacterium]|nr:sarcosine oxidase subunit gamma [Acetobacteraceae bacterium]MSP29674.1 sarcosine oxidase subunit gamma [Acetobacteraceae bacterium]